MKPQRAFQNTSSWMKLSETKTLNTSKYQNWVHISQSSFNMTPVYSRKRKMLLWSIILRPMRRWGSRILLERSTRKRWRRETKRMIMNLFKRNSGKTLGMLSLRLIRSSSLFAWIPWAKIVSLVRKKESSLWRPLGCSKTYGKREKMIL